MVVCMIYLESLGISQSLQEYIPILVLEDGDTALTILGACIGGLISMMVFSFSMVMLLLSQASSNFSPRLLPGLISNKKHQVILGIYIATILYNLLILLSINPSSSKSELPAFSVLIGMVFTVSCLVAFIYFIHSISQGIQISNIMVRLSQKAKTHLQKSLEEESKLMDNLSLKVTEDWRSYSLSRTGYFQDYSVKELIQFCEKFKTKIAIQIPKGFFLQKETVFFSSEKPLNEEQIEEFTGFISFGSSELVRTNYLLGFKQLTEIINKAMSPAVNDPGTAINAIDYLTELFALRMQKKDTTYIQHKEVIVAQIATVSLEELLQQVFSSLRTYCKDDPIIVQKLLEMLQYLQNTSKVSKSYQDALQKQKQNLLKECLQESKFDKSFVQQRYA